MDVADDAAVGQRPHGVAEDVVADRLGDVLHELRPVALNAEPVLCAVHAHICHALPAETVSADLGLNAGKPPPAGQGDEQHPVPRLETDAPDLRGDMLFDGL